VSVAALCNLSASCPWLYLELNARFLRRRLVRKSDSQVVDPEIVEAMLRTRAGNPPFALRHVRSSVPEFDAVLQRSPPTSSSALSRFARTCAEGGWRGQLVGSDGSTRQRRCIELGRERRYRRRRCHRRPYGRWRGRCRGRLRDGRRGDLGSRFGLRQRGFAGDCDHGARNECDAAQVTDRSCEYCFIHTADEAWKDDLFGTRSIEGSQVSGGRVDGQQQHHSHVQRALLFREPRCAVLNRLDFL
jgi:hypothetical protein